MSEWMLIETAPKDGERVRLLCPGGEDVGFYDDYTTRDSLPNDPFTGQPMHGEWSTDKGNGEPTHWKPRK